MDINSRPGGSFCSGKIEKQKSNSEELLSKKVDENSGGLFPEDSIK